MQKKRKKKLSGGVAQHTTEQNYCSSTDSREQTICLRYSLCSYSKLTASNPSITAPSQYHSRPQKYLLKGEEQIFIYFFFYLLCARWKRREGEGWKKLALKQTWMDSAQLIKIKRFNSREIEAAIQRAWHVGAILISSQPAHSSTFWCETIFCIFNYTLQQPSNYQNQAHLHDWNIIMVCQKHSSVLVSVTILFTLPCFPAEINLQWQAYKPIHQDKSLTQSKIIKLMRTLFELA